MIKVTNLTITLGSFSRKYKNFHLVKGDVLMISGENGCGKTLLLNTICGLVEYQNGSIQIKGNDHKLEKWKAYTSVFIDRNFLIPYLKPYEYFDLVILLSNIDKNEGNKLVKLYSEKLFFTDFEKQIKNLSLGNQKKIGIISTLITNPEIIILDEPFANLDEKSQLSLNAIFKDLSVKGTIVIYTNHPNKESYYTTSYKIL